MNKVDVDKEAGKVVRHDVHFVGAGPGDPELITVKGQRLLQEAEVVIYTGSLVPKALITGLKAEIHNSAGLNLDEVFAIILESWQAGTLRTPSVR